MITEHNYPKIWLLQVATPKGFRWLNRRFLPTSNEKLAQVFLNLEDAERYAQQTQSKVIEVELPFKLEYEMTKTGLSWQQQRYYRTHDTAQAGFEYYLENARGTWAGDRIFRLTDVRTGGVIASAQPNTASSGQQVRSA